MEVEHMDLGTVLRLLMPIQFLLLHKQFMCARCAWCMACVQLSARFPPALLIRSARSPLSWQAGPDSTTRIIALARLCYTQVIQRTT